MNNVHHDQQNVMVVCTSCPKHGQEPNFLISTKVMHQNVCFVAPMQRCNIMQTVPVALTTGIVLGAAFLHHATMKHNYITFVW